MLDKRALIGAFPWRYEGLEGCPCPIVAFLDAGDNVEAVGNAAKAIFEAIALVLDAPGLLFRPHLRSATADKSGSGLRRAMAVRPEGWAAGWPAHAPDASQRGLSC